MELHASLFLYGANKKKSVLDFFLLILAFVADSLSAPSSPIEINTEKNRSKSSFLCGQIKATLEEGSQVILCTSYLCCHCKDVLCAKGSKGYILLLKVLPHLFLGCM